MVNSSTTSEWVDPSGKLFLSIVDWKIRAYWWNLVKHTQYAFVHAIKTHHFLTSHWILKPTEQCGGGGDKETEWKIIGLNWFNPYLTCSHWTHTALCVWQPLSLSQPTQSQDAQISPRVWFINYLLMREHQGCANGARQKNSEWIHCPWEALNLSKWLDEH